jgi:hypothetical protein
MVILVRHQNHVDERADDRSGRSRAAVWQAHRPECERSGLPQQQFDCHTEVGPSALGILVRLSIVLRCGLFAIVDGCGLQWGRSLY